MTEAGRWPGPQGLIQGLAWLAVAGAFGHLMLGTTRPPATDLRGWFAVAGALSLALAGVTWSSHGRTVRLASGAAAIAIVLLALALIALHVAHETGLVLLAGGALNAALPIVSSWASDPLPTVPEADRT